MTPDNSVDKALLRANGLSASVYNRNRGREFHFFRNVSFHIAPDEVVGLVGESGSGKTRLGLSLLGLLREGPGLYAGSLSYRLSDAEPLDFSFQHNGGKKRGEPLRKGLAPVLGKRIGLVMQGAKSALNPYQTIGTQLKDTLALAGCPGTQIPVVMEQLLSAFSLASRSASIAHRYPFALSGGQAHRVMIALGFAMGPDLLVADEPTTGVDSPIQALILQHFKAFRKGTLGPPRHASRPRPSMLFITHQIDLMKGLTDRVMVMYAGELLEVFHTSQLGQRPHHPYTERLMEIANEAGGRAAVHSIPQIPGRMPVMYDPPEACVFADRCSLANERCRKEKPELVVDPQGQGVACHERH